MGLPRRPTKMVRRSWLRPTNGREQVRAEPLRDLQLLIRPRRHEVSQQGVAVAVDSQHRGGSLADSEHD
jgi:hypothetical protein